MLVCFSSVRSPVSANAQECAPEKKEEKALPIPQAPLPRLAALEIIERCACASLPLLLRCRGRRLVGPGPSRQPSVRKSAFSSDPMREGVLGVALARPDCPMRVASAGCPSPHPVFWGGKTRAFCVAHCGPRLLAPSPGRNHAGQESVS